MKDIVLIHPAIDFEDNYPCSWIPYSVLSIASMLPKEKYNIRIFDQHKVSTEYILNECGKLNPFVVGISIMTGGGQIDNALFFAEFIKVNFPQCSIVFGGPHVNVLPVQTLQNGLIDYVIAGSGQDSFLNLINTLAEEKDTINIDGVYYKDKASNNVIFPRHKKSTIPHLYSYDFDLLNLNDYIRYDATISDRTINYIASQGCPYACNFCYECSYDKKYYTMEINNIQKDIEYLVEKYQVNGIKFYDADFFVNEKRCYEIINILRQFNLKWAASIHPGDIIRCNTADGNRLLSYIKNSNCTRLLMGMESGNDRVLNDIVNKHITRAQLLDVARMIGNYQILGSYTFMVGYPDETISEQADTFNLIQELRNLSVPMETKVHIYLPYPGTPLYDRAVDLGFAPPNQLKEWSEFNYYKAMTPWTDESLELKVSEFTKMIDKNKR